MPQLLIAVIAGAGLYAATRAIARMLETQAEAHRQRAEARKRAAAQAGGGLKDLGMLEWDETSGVYKPKTSSN